MSHPTGTQPGAWHRQASDYQAFGLSAAQAQSLLEQTREMHASLKIWAARAAAAQLAGRPDARNGDALKALSSVQSDLLRDCPLTQDLYQAEVLREFRRQPVIADKVMRSVVSSPGISESEFLSLASGAADLLSETYRSSLSVLRAAVTLGLLENEPCLIPVLLKAWHPGSPFEHTPLGPRGGEIDHRRRQQMVEEMVELDLRLNAARGVQQTLATTYWLDTAPSRLLPPDTTVVRQTKKLRIDSVQILPVHLRDKAKQGKFPKAVRDILAGDAHPLVDRGTDEDQPIIEHGGRHSALDPAEIWNGVMQQVRWMLEAVSSGAAAQRQDRFDARVLTRARSLRSRRDALGGEDERLSMNTLVPHVLSGLRWSETPAPRQLNEPEVQRWYLLQCASLARWLAGQAPGWADGWSVTQHKVSPQGAAEGTLEHYSALGPALSKVAAGPALDWLQLHAAWKVISGVTRWADQRSETFTGEVLLAAAQWNEVAEEVGTLISRLSEARGERSLPRLIPGAWSHAAVRRAIASAQRAPCARPEEPKTEQDD